MKAFIGLVVCVVALLAVVCTAGPPVLSVTTILQEPYTMTQGSELEGYCIDLLAEIAKKLDFKYTVHLVKDGKYGQQDESGNWLGMIGEVVRGEAELAVASLTLTATREQGVEMSTPFMQTGIGFILSRDLGSEESHSLSFSFPFSTEMWVGILLAFLVTGLCIYLVARISPCEWADPETDELSFTLLHSFWYITGALTLQGAGPHPKGLSGRVISAVWWVFAVVLLACYFSNFNAMLRSDSKHVSVNNFEELAKQDVIDYGTVEGGSTFNFFKNSNNPTYRRIYQHMERKKSCVASVEEGNRRTQEGNYAFIGEAASLDLAVARYCNLIRSSELIAMRGYSIAAPLGFPMMKNITVAILQLSESGELAFLQSKWWASSCLPEGGQAPHALQPHLLRGLFLLLALGLGLGLLMALLELASKARSQAKEQKKSCCSVLLAELSQRFGSRGAKAGTETSEKSKA
ncbi:probable glutamate receptor [Salvelinus namaycush]|uniref:Glutamate receptor n=2 Tax=Salvelinus namaycush TaxID=8040 RepID=A0A8U1ELS8_SALNM|nr:probable glutamate receptor [Salvelinus namaycush]